MTFMQKEFYAEYFEIEDKHWWFVGRRRFAGRPGSLSEAP